MTRPPVEKIGDFFEQEAKCGTAFECYADKDIALDALQLCNWIKHLEEQITATHRAQTLQEGADADQNLYMLGEGLLAHPKEGLKK